MKIGIQVIQSRDQRAVDIAEKAEAAGFDGLWLAGSGDNYLKACTLLNATSTITVGTSITPALLASPSFHASMAKYLQETSGGRFVLGFGSQTKGQIRMELGIDPPKIAKMSREVVEVTKGILSGQPFEYDGEFQHRHGPGRRMRGVAVTPPPIYYSGVGPMNLRVAGRYTDGFLAHPIFTKKYYEDVVWPEIDKGLDQAGKTRADFDMVAMPMTLIVEDEAERPTLMRAAKRNLANYFTTHAYGTFMDMNGWAKQREEVWAVSEAAGRNPAKFDWVKLEAAITDDMVDEVCLLGTADEVKAKATKRYAGIADYLDFYPMHDSSHSAEEGQAFEYENVLKFIRAFKGFNK